MRHRRCRTMWCIPAYRAPCAHASNISFRALLFLRGQHRFCVGLCEIVPGIRLILTCLLSVSGQRLALLSSDLVVSVGLSHGDVIGALGVGVVKVIGLVIDLRFSLVRI